MATASLRHGADVGNFAPPITLLWVRPDEASAPEGVRDLDLALTAIVARYAPMVRLEIVTELPPVLGRGPGKPAPTLVVLRHGQIVGEAMGTQLPARELARVVRCAVEWPSDIR